MDLAWLAGVKPLHPLLLAPPFLVSGPSVLCRHIIRARTNPLKLQKTKGSMLLNGILYLNQIIV